MMAKNLTPSRVALARQFEKDWNLRNAERLDEIILPNAPDHGFQDSHDE